MVKKAFKPGGKRGKLHKRLGIPVSQKIPQARLETAAHSPEPDNDLLFVLVATGGFIVALFYVFLLLTHT